MWNWYLLITLEARPTNLTTWPQKYELYKDHNSKHSKVYRGKVKRPQPYTKRYNKLRNTESQEGDIVSAQESMPIDYPTTNDQPWKHTYAEDYLDGSHCIWEYKYMHATTVGKKGHEFDSE